MPSLFSSHRTFVQGPPIVSGGTTITELLEDVAAGDRAALNALLPLVYDELMVLAHRQRIAWRGDFTLNTTALVHEAWLKLADGSRLPAESRTHFLAVASKAMRHILCNYARDRRRLKRGGGVQHVTLDPIEARIAELDLSDDHSEMLAALDEALRRLERVADRQARVVESRVFGGLSVEETAAALGISARSVKRDWSFARAWLAREIRTLVND
jgi:RNA polymerase sigma factor (TIGR02999 family)